MDAKVFLSAEALRDLEAIVLCHGKPADPEAGARRANLMLDQALSLCRLPTQGRAVRQFRPEKLRELQQGTSRLIYRVSPDGGRIEIVRILLVEDLFEGLLP